MMPTWKGETTPQEEAAYDRLSKANAEHLEECLLKNEKRCVVRCFQRYTSIQRANLAASTHRRRAKVGEYFYMHPDIPNVAFKTRTQAATAGLKRKAIAQVEQRKGGKLPYEKPRILETFFPEAAA